MNANVIYFEVLLKIIEQYIKWYIKLDDISKGVKDRNRNNVLSRLRIKKDVLLKEISRLEVPDAIEAIQSIQKTTEENVGLQFKMFDLSGKRHKKYDNRINKKIDPSIDDVHTCYSNLFGDANVSVLLLLDEVNALPYFFFESSNGDSMFEILMNQLKNSHYIRYKAALYSDRNYKKVTGLGFGEIFTLDYSIRNEYELESYRKVIQEMLHVYLVEQFDSKELTWENFFTDQELCMPLLINGSNGNLRRLVTILNKSCRLVIKEKKDSDNPTIDHQQIERTILNMAKQVFGDLSYEKRSSTSKIARSCILRNTFRFRIPDYEADMLNIGKELNEMAVVYVDDLAEDERGSIFSFDYAYSLLKNIPTHIQLAQNDSPIEKTTTSLWIEDIATLDRDVIEQVNKPGSRMSGIIESLDGESGIIKNTASDKTYAFNTADIIDGHKYKILNLKRRVLFTPKDVKGTKYAHEIEVY